jgi:hypothetical protein
MVAFSFKERPGAARQTSNPPTFETEYVAAGIFDRPTVHATALSLIPTAVAVTEGILYRQDIDLKEAGAGLYYIRAPYSRNNSTTGSIRFAFSTTGGSFHIKTSRESVARYPNTAEDFKQLINVKKSSGKFDVEGTDIIIPALKMSYTVKHPLGMVNEDFARAIAGVTSCCNSTVFRGFQPGEVLFLGADGSQGTDSEAEVTCHFAAEKNLQDLIIGDITGIEKNGHDFLWVTWEDDTVGGKPIAKPKAVYVERVYQRVDLATILGFGA